MSRLPVPGGLGVAVGLAAAGLLLRLAPVSGGGANAVCTRVNADMRVSATAPVSITARARTAYSCVGRATPAYVPRTAVQT
eukprot:COSAG01_NODE_45393_length_409_cov_9.648387_1_plen_80_part_10